MSDIGFRLKILRCTSYQYSVACFIFLPSDDSNALDRAASEESERMPRDHQFFVGRHHVDSDFTVRLRDDGFSGPVGDRIANCAKPREPFCDTAADIG